jgi:predicted dehydrogenase/nucleoside-diphosphate-sugar epimerase
MLKVGLVGAGYIAAWHAGAVAASGRGRVVAVADPAFSAAEALARASGARAFPSLADLLAEGGVEAVHLLTPPHLHAAQAEEALAAGVHVLIEKPMALAEEEARRLAAAAAAAGRVVAVNHNFLTLPSVERARGWLARGVPGRIDRIDIRWRYPLTPLRAGPYGLWMLRAPETLLFELGPHLAAFAAEFAGPLQDITLRAGLWIDLPGGGRLPQSIVIAGRGAGGAEVTLDLCLTEGAEDRSLEIRGVAGRLMVDFGADTLVVRRPNTADIVANPLRAELALAWAHLREGTVNAGRQLISLNRRQPYALGFQGAVGAFLEAAGGGAALPRGLSVEGGAEVTATLAAAARLLPAPALRPAPPAPEVAGPPVLVIGGTGFVGRALVRALVARGRAVRVLSRGRPGVFADLGGAVEGVQAALGDAAGLARAMEGAGAVVHLAKAEEATWEGYLANDVAVAERVGQAALAAGVGRMLYTGTIASYDASDPGATITEATPFGPMENRNLYARSKALCEARLSALQRERGLPLVIARPGIVVGPGGPLQHWGIGRWHGAGAVRMWGAGRNPLPFVLNEDVAEGLIAALDRPGVEGRSFNLVGPPVMSARDWFAAIRRVTGVAIRAEPGNLTLFWAADLAKYALKRGVLRKADLRKPLLADWRGRAHLARFSPEGAMRGLDWRPEPTAEGLAERALRHPGLFGY